MGTLNKMKKMKSDNKDPIKPMMQNLQYEMKTLQDNEMFENKISTQRIHALKKNLDFENPFNDEIQCIIMNTCRSGVCDHIYKSLCPWLSGITPLVNITLSYMCKEIKLYDHNSDEELYYHGGLNAEICIPGNSTKELTLSVILLNNAIEHKTFSVTTEQSDLFKVYNLRDIELGLSVKIC